jgi:hypothetical protein
MRFGRILLALALIVPVSAPGLAADSHRLLTDILSDHIKDGMVNYGALCKDARLGQYVQQLARINPDRISSEKERLAFWINAYNAYTLKIVCDNYPLKSIQDLNPRGLRKAFAKTVWDKPLVTVNNRPTTLNTIEHKIIRTRFKDPRIHFALVCAAKSCPPLRSEAYEEDKLDEQLDDQGREFLADASKNRFDTARRAAQISKIFSWFAKDFGGGNVAVLTFIAGFLPEDVADKVRANPGAWTTSYTDYDWSLNEQPTGRKTS